MSMPTLQKFAVRFLSQTASSSGCERNWSTFDWIHSKRRNRLEHERLNDLVYIQYNLHLKDRFLRSRKSYDPVNYESIDTTEFWITEPVPEGDIGRDELENLLEEIPICGEEPNEEVEVDSLIATDDLAAYPGFAGENEDWLALAFPQEEPLNLDD